MLYNPTIHLLTIPELLQSKTEISTQELAQELEVDERSIRRLVDEAGSLSGVECFGRFHSRRVSGSEDRNSVLR